MHRDLSRFAGIEETEDFAHPKHERGRGYDDEPVSQRQGDDVEETAADGDDDYLPDEDEQGDGKKFAAVLEMKCRAVRGESLGIEHVPKLEENEGGKEQAELVGAESFVFRNPVGTADGGQRREVCVFEII